MGKIELSASAIAARVSADERRDSQSVKEVAREILRERVESDRLYLRKMSRTA
jgi:hypothetical protein